MLDIVNEDYRGCWLLICEDHGVHRAFIDKEPITLPQGDPFPQTWLLELRRQIDTRKAQAWDAAARPLGRP